MTQAELDNVPVRVWVNQPSTLQEFHHLHGKRGLAMQDTTGHTVIYFTDFDSPLIAQGINPSALDLF